VDLLVPPNKNAGATPLVLLVAVLLVIAGSTISSSSINVLPLQFVAIEAVAEALVNSRECIGD
jgi:hypothetical protein